MHLAVYFVQNSTINVINFGYKYKISDIQNFKIKYLFYLIVSKVDVSCYMTPTEEMHSERK